MSELASVRKSLLLLRKDALDRGMQELAIAYGWAAIDIGWQMVATACVCAGPNSQHRF